jgi:hypothetical protein
MLPLTPPPPRSRLATEPGPAVMRGTSPATAAVSKLPSRVMLYRTGLRDHRRQSFYPHPDSSMSAAQEAGAAEGGIGNGGRRTMRGFRHADPSMGAVSWPCFPRLMQRRSRKRSLPTMQFRMAAAHLCGETAKNREPTNITRVFDFNIANPKSNSDACSRASYLGQIVAKLRA